MTQQSIDAIAKACLRRWKAIYRARDIDFSETLTSAGPFLKRRRRGSPEWAAEWKGAEWLDHYIPVGRGHVTFRSLVRSDLLLLLISATGSPSAATAMLDALVPPAASV